jgi:hypothetical protein
MRVLVTLVLALILAGCAAQRGDGAGSAPTQEEPSANATEETTSYNEETTVLDDFPEPPDSTLSFGRQEVKGTPGTYCWSSGPSGYSSGCLDAFGPPTGDKQETLTVPTGSETVFRYGGQSPTGWPSHPPKTVEAGAYSLKKLKKAGGVVRPDRTLKVRGSGVQRTIPAELPPGEYALEVFVKGRQYDATYYFRVVVE